MTDKKVDAYIVKNFRDAGIEENFTGGSVRPMSEGAFINYEAAGLVRKPTADDAKAAKASETKATDKA